MRAGQDDGEDERVDEQQQERVDERPDDSQPRASVPRLQFARDEARDEGPIAEKLLETREQISNKVSVA
jgi:hypothetical protein